MSPTKHSTLSLVFSLSRLLSIVEIKSENKVDEGGGQTVSLENTTRKKEKTKTLQLLSLSLSKFSLLQARPFPSLLSLLGGKRQVAEHVLLCADRGEREELLHCLRGRPLGSVAVAVICFFSSFVIFSILDGVS